MKYIMFQQTIGGITRKIPIIFPDILVHEDVAKVILSILMKEDKEVLVINAGFCLISCENTSGKSTTLKIAANETDYEIINLYDYFHGVQ